MAFGDTELTLKLVDRNAVDFPGKDGKQIQYLDVTWEDEQGTRYNERVWDADKVKRYSTIEDGGYAKVVAGKAKNVKKTIWVEGIVVRNLLGVGAPKTDG